MTRSIRKEADALQDILARKMKEQGLNQRGLSKLTGIREAKLSNLLRMSTRKLKLGDLEVICRAVGIDPATILNTEGYQ